ncbi:chaperonin 10-like protein [Hyaloraphidium curvatum]|nr:chaperonin 10-like protein [Hyaloraphidium curvatum]
MSVSSNVRKIIPLFDRILVQRVKAQERTASGIFIPEKAQEQMNEGVVVAAGPGALDKDGKTIPVACKVGDKVLLPPYGGNNVKMGEQEYILYRDSEILGKLE